VERVPTEMLLPTPDLAARARRLASDFGATTIWFGAAAPLAAMAPVLREGPVTRIVASTHGHEVGWSMMPGSRQILRLIGESTDAVTYVSEYTRRRVAAAFGPRARLVHQPGGVDTERFRPDPLRRKATRQRYGLEDRDVIVCLSRLVPRKGQDSLIRAMPRSSAVRPAPSSSSSGAGRTERRWRAWRVGTGWPTTWSSPVASPPTRSSTITAWRTCSPCRAGPGARDSTSRAWGSSIWRPRRAGCPWSRAAVAVPPRRCWTSTRDSWWTAPRTGRSSRRWPACSRTGRARRRWACAAGTGCSTAGAGKILPAG